MAYLYTIDERTKIDLSDYSTKEVSKLSKDDAASKVADLGAKLDVLQESLYAAATHSVLIILQAMDTGGKDGTVSHVFKYINPQGCGVTSFKQPTPDELAHDFLWRAHLAVPPKGKIEIFNRSHYEDVLVVRVHNLVSEKTWKKRYQEIEQFEALLSANSTIVLKFFLHISKDEQKERLLAREDDPEKTWKLSANDWQERLYWDKYKEAYEDAIGKTAVKIAPWHIVPADNKWYRNVAIADKIVDTLEKYKSGWEKELERIGADRKSELTKMRLGNPALAAEALQSKNK